MRYFLLNRNLLKVMQTDCIWKFIITWPLTISFYILECVCCSVIRFCANFFLMIFSFCYTNERLPDFVFLCKYYLYVLCKVSFTIIYLIFITNDTFALLINSHIRMVTVVFQYCLILLHLF